MENEYEVIRVAGRVFAFCIEHDDSMGPPWEEHDGHGPVTDWEARAKLPGEMILNESRDGSRRFYDFAEACRMARRDGWGFLPGKLQTARINGRWQSWVDGKSRRTGRGRWAHEKLFRAVADDINAAIRETYAKHRATMTARQYAAGAALADFERLRGWCSDDWSWCGVVVAPIDGEGGPGWSGEEVASLWGIENDSPEYHRQVAGELAEAAALA